MSGYWTEDGMWSESVPGMASHNPIQSGIDSVSRVEEAAASAASEEITRLRNELRAARQLVCDLWATFPQAQDTIANRTGRWFALGADRDLDYIGRDLKPDQFKLTGWEMDQCATDPHVLRELAELHDVQQTEADAMGVETQGNQRRMVVLKAEADRIQKEWEE